MHFIGVTTAQSSINGIFPQWAARLGLGNCELRGWDFPLHDDPAHFRAAVEFIQRDPLSLGALVTSHKVGLFAACRDQFDEIEPVSRSLGEISSIYKRRGRLHGRSVDPWTCGHALAAFLSPDHWRREAEVLVLGAGGAGTALVWHLANASPPGRPARIHVVDKSPRRIEHLGGLHRSWAGAAPVAGTAVTRAEEADEILRALPRGSLVVNATGLGKDAPGSPLPAAAVFPEQGIAWDFNYRGELEFLQQARAQQATRGVTVVDGWVYFLHGWTRVIADVFDREIPTSGRVFDELGAIASAAR